ncbi:MAG: methylenetetrahydrofolate reductase [Pseudomonadota bacterium]
MQHDTFRAISSIEVTAKHALENEGLETMFQQGKRVYLADLGTHDVPALIRAARRLTDSGYRPVPHIAARRMADAQDYETRIAGFTQDAGATEFLMVAGSPEKQVGPFPSSLELLRTDVLRARGVADIVVAGHPEGSPDFPDSALLPSLREKVEIAARDDMNLKIATQFSFDADRIIAWEQELKAAGITAPIDIGVAGPAKLTTLIKYATLCGVGQSLSFLKKRGGALMALATKYAPTDVVEPLERHIAEHPESLIKAIHMFPFGGLKGASDWLYEHGNWQRDLPAAA